MIPENFERRPYAKWLEGAIQAIVSQDPQSIMIATRTEDGEVMTGYFNADAEMKGIFAQNIQNDITLEIIGLNQKTVEEMWEDQENENQDA